MNGLLELLMGSFAQQYAPGGDAMYEQMGQAQEIGDMFRRPSPNDAKDPMRLGPPESQHLAPGYGLGPTPDRPERGMVPPAGAIRPDLLDQRAPPMDRPENYQRAPMMPLEDETIPVNAQWTQGPPIGIPAPGTPMPRPDPRKAMAQNPGAPLDIAPPPFAAQPAPQRGRGLLGMNPEDVRRITSSLAGGLSSVRSGALPGEGLARGLGGSFGGAEKFDRDQDTRRQKLLDTSVRMRGQDFDREYRQGTLGVARENAGTSRFSAQSQDAYRRRDQTIGANNRRSPVQDIDAANREVERRMRNFPALPAGASEQERQQHEQAREQREKQMRERVYQEYGIVPGGADRGPSRRNIGAPVSGEGTGPADVADVEGQGTQQTPFRPRDRAQYDALPSGTYFIHRDGSLRLKP